MNVGLGIERQSFPHCESTFAWLPQTPAYGERFVRIQRRDNRASHESTLAENLRCDEWASVREAKLHHLICLSFYFDNLFNVLDGAPLAIHFVL